MPTAKKTAEVVIVGGAAAGLTAAIFAARRGLKTVVVTKDIGGQLATTTDVANYPGFLYIKGFELARRMAEQATANGAEIILDEVVSLAADENGCTVTARHHTVTGRTLIIALGKAPRSLGISGESELLGRGVYYAAASVIERYAGQEVAVVGGGSSAFTTLKLAATKAKTVHHIHHHDQFKAERALVDEVRKLPNIIPHLFTEVTNLNGADRLELLTLRQLPDGREETLHVAAVFVNVGYEIKPALFADMVKLDARRQIIVDQTGTTSRPGVFAAGDITNRLHNQIAVSVGEGATAALSAYTYLTGKPAGADWGKMG